MTTSDSGSGPWAGYPQQAPQGYGGWSPSGDGYRQPDFRQPDHQQPGYPSTGFPSGGYAGAPGPNTPPPASAAGPANRRGWAQLVIGLVVGLVVAVGVGAILVATGALSLGSNKTEGPDTRAVTLPATLAGFEDYGKAVSDKTKKPEQAQKVLATQQHTDQRTIAAYQAAFGGAAVGAHRYANSELTQMPYVIAVRANAPQLVNGPVTDPADLGLAQNPQTVQSFGDVQCQVFTTRIVVTGKTVDPEKLSTNVCERTGSGATVWVYGLGQGTQGQQQMIAITNSAWASVAAQQ